MSAGLSERVEVLLVAAYPGPKRYLIDGRIERRIRQTCLLSRVADQDGGSDAEVCEVQYDVVGEDIKPIGDAPVTEVPDDLCSCSMRCMEHRQETGPVVDARDAFDQMPAQAVTHGTNSRLCEEVVVSSAV